jgi:hypothetical protein
MHLTLILLLVTQGEANDESTQGAVRASYEIFGSNVEVRVREIEHVPDDELALALGSAMHASATIELSWDREHRVATLRYHLASEEGYRVRSIGFGANDDPRERGRTIGFAVASMIPPVVEGAGSVSAPPQAHAEGSVAPPFPIRRFLGGLEVTGVAATGIGGNAGAEGGSVGLRWFPTRSIGVRAAGSIRAGEVTVAQAGSRFMYGGLGVVALPWPSTPARPWELGARVDALVMREELSHFSSDDIVPDRQSRWLPGADAAVEATWFFASAAGLTGAMGLEVALGETAVAMHHVQVATIPPVRLVWQLGVRAGF